MSFKQAVKHGVKRLLPTRAINYGQVILELCRIYPSYVFMKGKAPAPQSVTIDITFRCTCRCVMCSLYGEHRDAWSKEERDKELSTKEWLRVMDELHLCGIHNVCFTGGEPLLRKDLFEIMGHAKKRGLSVNVLTSGAPLRPDVASRLVKVGLDDISVSIDGPREVHNAIRRSDVFDKAVAGIREIRTVKQRLGTQTPNITIACTIQKMNQNHLHELVPLAHELGAYLSYGPLFFANQDAGERSQESGVEGDVTKDEDQGVLDSHRCVDVDILHNEFNRVQEEAQAIGQPVYLPLNSKSDIKLRFYDPGYSILNKCFLPWYASRIDPFGNVYPCSVNVNCGNVRKTPFRRIWNGPKYLKFRRALKRRRLFPGCEKCCALTPERKIWNIAPCIGP